MLASAKLLTCVTILHFTTADAWAAPLGCCYTIGYGQMMKPCCLKAEDNKGQAECLNAGNLVGGKTGWNPSCPASSEEAHKWLTQVQTNLHNCPPKRPAAGAICSGSQDCHYNVYMCPDGSEHYNAGHQCVGEKKWTKDAHVCLDGTTHHKIHALCINGAWVVSSLPLGCQDCLANLASLGDSGSCSLVTQGDAVVAAHKVWTCMVVGGTLTDGSPNEHAAVDGPAYIKELAPGGRWNFNGGGPYSNASVDFGKLEKLVSDPYLQNFSYNNYSVFVVSKGGTFHQGMFRQCENGCQPEDNGKTLVIFNTKDPITINNSNLGRQFGPSILAPFSEVTVLGTAGYVDGCVVAKSFKTEGKWASGLQLHGDCYRGPLCSTKPFPPDVTTSPPPKKPNVTTPPPTVPVVTVTPPPKPTQPCVTITPCPKKPDVTNSPPDVKPKNDKPPKWWWWLVGVSAGVAAAAIPLAVTGGVECAKHTGGVSSSGGASSSSKYSREDAEGYRLGEEFGRAWAFPLVCGLVVLIVMSIVVARFRSRNRRSTWTIVRDEQLEAQEESNLMDDYSSRTSGTAGELSFE